MKRFDPGWSLVVFAFLLAAAVGVGMVLALR